MWLTVYSCTNEILQQKVFAFGMEISLLELRYQLSPSRHRFTENQISSIPALTQIDPEYLRL